MKKIFVLLALVFLITGCGIKVMPDDNLEEVIDEVLTSKDDLKNQYFAGYQYYLPRGVSLIEKFDYNTTLLYMGNKMYLYVDIISYHHKVEEDYELEEDIYFSKLLEHDNKKGYINVYQENNGYYIEVKYNYGKIETYTEEKYLTNTIMNSLYILKTLKFNDAVIDSLIGENKIEYKEEKFDLFKSDSDDNGYLDIIEKNDEKYEEEDELIDDDKINIDIEDELIS